MPRASRSALLVVPWVHLSSAAVEQASLVDPSSIAACLFVLERTSLLALLTTGRTSVLWFGFSLRGRSGPFVMLCPGLAVRNHIQAGSYREGEPAIGERLVGQFRSKEFVRFRRVVNRRLR
jgi:hypothetical protein